MPRNLTEDDLRSFAVKHYLAISDEIDKREIEALRLYEPLPWQETFHSVKNKECIVVKGNQVGGSAASFVEVARAVTGQDPYDKYPKKDGVAVVLGFGEPHIGRVIHKYLFRAGAFFIIRDLDTGKWRTYRPWEPDREVMGKLGDLDREEEKKLAPPLIPNRYIDGKIAYRKRSENIFTYVKFTTGWELYALNSAGDASQAQGFQADLYMIDEDVATAGWHEEAIGRTAVRRGLIRWNALPHAKTDDIMKMIERADEEEEEGVQFEERTTVKLQVTMWDNPYYPDEAKKQNEKIWKSQGEEVYRKRALGEVVLDSVLMYPTWHKKIHGAISHEEQRHAIQAKLTETLGNIPEGWCRYMVVDPGHTICAVAFFAVPPAPHSDIRVMYDELYLHKCDAVKFGQNVEPKVKPYCFQEFIVDMHGGNLRDLGSGELPFRMYEKELERRGMESVSRGPRFVAGSDQVKGREEKLRQWLSVKDNGTPTLLVITERCVNFCREIERFKKKTVKIGGQDVPTDDGNRRANSHLVECVEMAAAHGMPFVLPKRSAVRKSAVSMIIEGRKRRAAQRAVNNFDPQKSGRVLGPRGSGAA